MTASSYEFSFSSASTSIDSLGEYCTVALRLRLPAMHCICLTPNAKSINFADHECNNRDAVLACTSVYGAIVCKSFELNDKTGDCVKCCEMKGCCVGRETKTSITNIARADDMVIWLLQALRSTNSCCNVRMYIMNEPGQAGYLLPICKYR